MRPAPPALFPLLRSDLQARILARVYLGDEEESVAELAAAIAADPGNTAREVARLEEGRVLASRRIGRTKLVRADTSAPHYQPLRDLLSIVLGPATVLREALTGISGIKRAEIFGSWAVRYLGERGPAPADIDLLIVGSPNRDDLHDATEQAATRLNRLVNPVVISERRWESSNDGFIVELRSRPRVPVIEPVETSAVAS
ncbi:ArsR family transcriptional regulator [Kribbella sp. NBC_01245]|uniref:ArsR family transcriptional regulator n=1 Tax=Kribbella sp. NBC_01245 TaxID=2903578 RepID=UPI002E27B248|nr:ArsR family transcriptional regulator [Kribbella sp. NBC_01245]